MAVKSALEAMGLHYRTVDLGEVDVMEEMNTEQ